MFAPGIATTAIAASAPQFLKPTYAATAPTIFDQVKQYVDMLTTGQFPIPPWAATLDGHVPDVSGIPRDDDNIICQPETNATPAPDTFAPMHTAHGLLNGGDSAARTGVAAFCNSKQDIELLFQGSRRTASCFVTPNTFLGTTLKIALAINYWLSCLGAGGPAN